MPKRATLTFSSEDAPKGEETKLYVYYCKYSGKNAFITDCDITKLPRRRTDLAYVMDTKQHMIRLYTTDGGTKLLRRKSGAVERQYRLNVGKLPVAYKCDAGSSLLYIIDESVTTYVQQATHAHERVPVPPCIKRVSDGTTEVRLDIEDKAAKAALLKVVADAVRVQITANVSHTQAAQQELLQFFAKALGVRLGSLSLARGSSNRNKVLLVDRLQPRQVYDKLQAQLHAAAVEAAGGNAATTL